MSHNANLLDKAALVQIEVSRLRRDVPDSVNQQIDALQNAILGLALYIAERDGIKLTQP